MIVLPLTQFPYNNQLAPIDHASSYRRSVLFVSAAYTHGIPTVHAAIRNAVLVICSSPSTMANPGLTPMPIEPSPDSAPRAAVAEKHAEKSVEEPQAMPLREYGLDYRVDPTVTFAEFRHWAKIEREEERLAELRYRERRGPMTFKKMIKSRFSKGVHHENQRFDEEDRLDKAITGPRSGENKGTEDADNSSSRSSVEEEWKTASKAMRTAGWTSIFFLVTTDILGWSGCP